MCFGPLSALLVRDASSTKSSVLLVDNEPKPFVTNVSEINPTMITHQDMNSTCHEPTKYLDGTSFDDLKRFAESGDDDDFDDLLGFSDADDDENMPEDHQADANALDDVSSSFPIVSRNPALSFRSSMSQGPFAITETLAQEWAVAVQEHVSFFSRGVIDGRATVFTQSDEHRPDIRALAAEYADLSGGRMTSCSEVCPERSGNDALRRCT